jgi:hypothetical protein
MYLKAIQRILWLTYGNHSSSSKSRSDAEVVLQALSKKNAVSRKELMKQIGLNESSSEDVLKFNDRIKPLRGRNPSNPLELCFLVSDKRESGVYYSLSRPAFDASLLKLKSDVLDFFERYRGGEVPDSKVLDQVIWLAYANHSNTYRHREEAREVLKYLIRNGETGKRELMRVTSYEYGDENDDQSFRGMMKYLRASWKSEEASLNPLHTGNHGFLVRQKREGQTAFYSVSMKEFKSSMNVVAGNIRSFMP